MGTIVLFLKCRDAGGTEKRRSADGLKKRKKSNKKWKEVFGCAFPGSRILFRFGVAVGKGGKKQATRTVPRCQQKTTKLSRLEQCCNEGGVGSRSGRRAGTRFFEPVGYKIEPILIK